MYYGSSFKNLQYYFGKFEPLTELNNEQQAFVWRLFAMAGKGKKFIFHGSFASKAAAVKKESETPGAFIREKTVNGRTRFFVLSPKGEK